MIGLQHTWNRRDAYTGFSWKTWMEDHLKDLDVDWRIELRESGSDPFGSGQSTV